VCWPELPRLSIDSQDADEMPERAGERIPVEPLHPEAS
jgi:hypothetical protein